MLSEKKFSTTELLDSTLNWFAQDIDEFSMSDKTLRKNVTSYEVGNRMIERYPELNSKQFVHLLEPVLDRLYSDGYIDRRENLQRTRNDSSEFIYSVKLDAYDFCKSGGYKKKKQREKKAAFWKKVEDLPKRYWFVALLITTQAYNVRDLITDGLNFFSRPAQKEITKKFPQQDTSGKH